MKDLITVFQDTIEHCQELHTQCQTKKYNFSDIYRAPLTGLKENISVINSDTVSALVDCFQSGKTCVLNMASYQRPGGGVYNGAKAQEECLFRCSNLSSVIGTEHYPLKESEALYTTDAIFFKDVNYDYMQEITCDVVTLPALRLSGVLDTRGNIYHQSKGPEYRDITKNKIRLMLSLAHKMNCRNIILGAWGCGVYGNDPEVISGYFNEVLVSECYSQLFNKVIFAIINDENSVGNNFEIFKNCLDS
jgi:uncharacterized protein (TIGR02452 family)